MANLKMTAFGSVRNGVYIHPSNRAATAIANNSPEGFVQISSRLGSIDGDRFDKGMRDEVRDFARHLVPKSNPAKS